MEISKKGKIALYSIPIFIGIYLIYKQFANSKAAKEADNGDENDGTSKSDEFPLHNGSRDAGSPYAPAGRVLALQRMINQKGYVQNGKTLKLKEDGIYGPKTTAAVEYWIHQDTVDNSDDWQSIFRNIAPYIAAPAKTELPNTYNPKF